MRAIRSVLTPALLVLALLMTSGQVVASRLMSSPAGSLVLCTGQGPVTVLVDENGAPVGPVHVCPDCLAASLAVVLPAVPLLSGPCVARRIGWGFERPVRAGSQMPVARARGPPVFV